MGNTARNYSLVDDVSTKNYIINGAVDFYQRQNVGGIFLGEIQLTGSPLYSADRWTGFIQSGSFGAQTTMQRASSPTPPIVDCQYSLNIKSTTPTNPSGVIRVSQRIEASVIRELAGRTASLSFYILRGATTSTASTLTVSMATPTVADTFSSMNSAFTLPGGASTAVYSFGGAGTWVLCQLHGISIPSNATNGLEVYFDLSGWDTTAGTQNQNITAVMLNAGLKCAQFKRYGASLAEELIACQRYFEKSYDVNTALGTNTADGMWGSPLAAILGDGTMTVLPWKVTKRNSSGSITNLIWSQIGTANKWQSFNSANTGTDRDLIINWISEYGMSISIDNSSTDLFGQGHWAVDCEL